jgi:hypothetical protein
MKRLAKLLDIIISVHLFLLKPQKGARLVGGDPKKKWTDSRRREPLSAATMKQRKKNRSLSLFACGLSRRQPPRAKRKRHKSRTIRAHRVFLVANIFSISAWERRGARVVTQNPIRFWRQSINKRDGNFHREQRRRFLFSKKNEKKIARERGGKTRDANAKRAHRSNDRGEARFLSSKRGKEKREGERETPRVCVCVCVYFVLTTCA